MTLLTISLILAVFAQLLTAVSVLIDKYIVTSPDISHPVSYAFYVGLISGVVVVLLPFSLVTIPSTYVLLLSVLGGYVFIGSIWLLYGALKIASATDVVPWLAAVTTVVTFIVSFLLLQEDLPKSFPYALIFFVIGMLLVGHFRFNARSFVLVVISGIFFGLSAVLIKIIFLEASFIDGFFWSRMGNVLGAVSLLALPACRRAVFQTSKHAKKRTTALIFINRVIGGVAFLSVAYAINTGSVSVVKSLDSLQFLFIFLFIFLLRHRIPEWFEHEFRPGHVLHKVLAMTFIAVGFLILFI